MPIIRPASAPASHNIPRAHPSGPAVQHFGLNTLGCDFIIGDLHGHFRALRRELRRAGFDPAVDRLFAVGDLVDRGPRSEEAVDWILNKPWFHPVRGNHEQVAIECAQGCVDLECYIRNGGAWFVGLAADMQRAIAEVFSKLPLAIDVETRAGRIGIVHTEVMGDWDAFTASVANVDGPVAISALWGRKRFQSRDTTAVRGVAAVYVGHQMVSPIGRLGNTLYIDACVGIGRTPRLLIMDPRITDPASRGVPDVMPKKI